MTTAIVNHVANKKDSIIQVFDDLHQIPELSTQEFKTSAYIANYLKKHGFDVTTGIAGTGLVAYINSGRPGPTLGVRADMDALEHIVDGKSQAIHSCGHDGHSTMVLFTGIVAKEMGLVKKGALKLIFQPSEEQVETSGARAMIAEGVIDDLDMCVGIHLRPMAEGKLGEANSALKHGALTPIEAKIFGESAHGARPHLAKNPVDAIAAIVNAVNAIWCDPRVPSSVKVTAVHAGGTDCALIPDVGTVGLDLRADTNELMEELILKTKRAIELGAATVGCEVEINVIPGYTAAVFHEDMIKVAAKSIIEVLGEKGLLGEQRSSGAEDFHWFVQAKPGLKTTYLGLGADMAPGLHNPNMKFSKTALLNGVSILSTMVEKILG